MRKRPAIRRIAISIFVIGMMIFNFSRLTGSECIRTIHIVTLLTCGAAIGILLTSVFMLIRNEEPVRRNEQADSV